MVTKRYNLFQLMNRKILDILMSTRKVQTVQAKILRYCPYRLNVCLNVYTCMFLYLCLSVYPTVCLCVNKWPYIEQCCVSGPNFIGSGFEKTDPDPTWILNFQQQKWQIFLPWFRHLVALQIKDQVIIYPKQNFTQHCITRKREL